MIAHGIKALNFYMLFGGTNFEYWGSKGRTTSYDYTAPISECGGLWEKYREVKLIGDFIKLAGTHLVHSHEIKAGCECGTKGIETNLISDDTVGFLFVWNKNDKSITAKIKVSSPEVSPFSIQVRMRAGDAYFLPINLPLANGKRILYSNVQISAVSEHDGRPLIIAYGNPGDEATIYAGSRLHTETIKDKDQLFDWDGIYVLLTPHDRAARAVAFDSPRASLISDSYFTLRENSDSSSLNLEIQTRPGIDSFALLAAKEVHSILMDGKKVAPAVSPGTNLMRFSLQTQPVRIAEIPISDIRVNSEDGAPDTAGKVNVSGDSLIPLESQGDYQDGYTVYTGEFSLKKSSVLKYDYYDDDWHSVFIDGTMVPGLTGSSQENVSTISVPAGDHGVKIFYENEGRPNGDFMEQNKGLKSISSFTGDAGMKNLDAWKYAPTPSPYPAENPAEASLSFHDTKWKVVLVGITKQDFIRENEGWWFRKKITLTDAMIKENPGILFKAVDDNALVYVNGRLAGKHDGYDRHFEFSIGGLAKPGENVIAVYVQNIGGPGGIYRPVVLRWGRAQAVDADLKFHHSLNGEIAQWQDEYFDDSTWSAISRLGRCAIDAIHNMVQR